MGASMQMDLGRAALTKGRGVANPDAAILALNLWGGGGKGWWRDPSDPTARFKDAAGGTPASADGDALGRLSDKSGNGNHFTQSTPSKIPIFKTAGGLCWAKPDGLDDGLDTPPTTLANGISVYTAFDRVTDSQFLIGMHRNALNNYPDFFGVAQSGNGNPSYGGSNVGTPTMRVNGVAIGTTRQDLLAACPANTPVVLTIEGIAMATWYAVSSWFYPGFECSIRFFGDIACPNQSSANRSIIETWLGAKAGLTL